MNKIVVDAAPVAEVDVGLVLEPQEAGNHDAVQREQLPRHLVVLNDRLVAVERRVLEFCEEVAEAVLLELVLEREPEVVLEDAGRLLGHKRVELRLELLNLGDLARDIQKQVLERVLQI